MQNIDLHNSTSNAHTLIVIYGILKLRVANQKKNRMGIKK